MSNDHSHRTTSVLSITTYLSELHEKMFDSNVINKDKTYKNHKQSYNTKLN